MGNQLSVLSGTVCDWIILTGLTMEHELILKNRLKTARAEQGISQGELAAMVGVSRQTISYIETGQFNPPAKLALLLCIALDKKFEELFYFG